MVTQATRMIRREFRAMNTDCLLLVHPRAGFDAEAAIGRAEASVHEYEERFSRFLPSSELTRLNEDLRECVPVSRDLAGLLDRALGYARLTDGVFDPVVLADMISIGYDRSFERMSGESPAAELNPRVRFRWTDVHVDVQRRLVARPPGAMIDLGGIAKGAAADAAMAELMRHHGALVDLGGDIRTNGSPDDAHLWLVAMEDGDGATRDTVGLSSGAIATSSVRKRRWMNNGMAVHHILDPRTGRPASSDAQQCSAIAETAEEAEIVAKVGLILGVSAIDEHSRIGRALRVRGLAWLGSDGASVSTTGWRDHVHG